MLITFDIIGVSKALPEYGEVSIASGLDTLAIAEVIAMDAAKYFSMIRIVAGYTKAWNIATKGFGNPIGPIG